MSLLSPPSEFAARATAGIEDASRRLEQASPRTILQLCLMLVAGGSLTGIAGIYPLFFVITVIPAACVCIRSSLAACVLVALTSPLVAIGAVDVGFHLLPSYVLACAGLLGVLRRGEWRVVCLQAPDVLLAMFVFVAVVISVGNLGVTPDTTVVNATGANGPSLRSIAQLSALLLMSGIYVLFRVSVSTPEAWRTILRALLISFVLVAAYAGYQVLARLTGLPFAYVNERRALDALPLGQTSYVRVNSSLPEASPLAQFALIALFAALAALRVRMRDAWLPGRVAWLLLIVALGVMLASLSKAGLVGVCVALVLLARIGSVGGHRRLTLWAGIGGTLAVGVAMLAIRAPALISDPAGLVSSERYVRLGYWQAALGIAREHPLGVGVGNYTFYYPRYAPMEGDLEYYSAVSDAHNAYLEAVAETGWIGGALYTGFVLSLIGSALLRRPRDNLDAVLLVGLGAAVAGGAVMHLTYSYFYYPFEWVLAGLVGSGAALAAARGPIHTRRSVTSQTAASAQAG